MPPSDRQHHAQQQHAGTFLSSYAVCPFSLRLGFLDPFVKLFLSSQRINHSQEELYPPAAGLRPDERMQPHYQDYQHRDLDYQHRDLDFQRGPPGGGRSQRNAIK